MTAINIVLDGPPGPDGGTSWSARSSGLRQGYQERLAGVTSDVTDVITESIASIMGYGRLASNRGGGGTGERAEGAPRC